MASLFLSRFLGIIRDSIQASKFGIGPLTDSYRISFIIPDTIFFLVAGGALSSAFIPVFTEFITKDEEDKAWDLFSVITSFMTVIVSAAIAVLWVAAPALSAFFAHGKDPSLFPLITEMSRIVLPAQLAFFLSGLMFGCLYAKNRPSVPGLGPNLYNIGIIFGALVLSNFCTPGIVGMSWGAVLGAFLGNLVLPLIAIRSINAKFKVSFDLNTPGVKKVFRLMLPVVLGLSLPSVYLIIMQKFASEYGNGINTAVEYSDKLMRAPLGIFGQSMALAAFPVLSAYFAEKDFSGFKNQFERSCRTVIFLATPAAAILFGYASGIVALFYGHGRTTPESLIPVSNCLKFFAWGVIPWCIHPLLMRSYFATHQTKKPIIIGTVTTAFFFVLLLGLREAKMGYVLLPLASTVAAFVYVIVLGTALYRDIGGFRLDRIWQTLWKSGLAAAALSAVGYFLDERLLHISSKTAQAGLLVVFILISAWIYYFICRLLKVDETHVVDQMILKTGAKFGITAVPVDENEPS